MKKIAILGSKGIPASYSGFETSIEETATRIIKSNFDVTVFCRSNHYKNKLSSYKNVNLIYLPSIKTKHLDTITNTFISVVKSIIDRYDIIILYGVGNSIFLLIYKLLSIPVISVVDGADWKRKKWGKFAKLFLIISRHFAAKYSTFYVVDNQLLADDYSKRFPNPPFYIPYGASPEITSNLSILDKYNLKEKEYIIFVGRFVKEKGIDFLIKNYENIQTNIKLVIVGGNYLNKKYEEELKKTKDKRIIFPGFIYGNEYESLLKFALFYVSCSYLEGTSPSLLNAMAINGLALVSDIQENKEVLKDTCLTFKSGDDEDFKEKVHYYLKNAELIEKERLKTKEIIKKYYNWEKISKQYIDLFNKIII